MSDGAFFGSKRPRRRLSRPRDVFPTPDEIAERADELLKATDACAPMTPDDCWKRAEDELLDRGARRVTR